MNELTAPLKEVDRVEITTLIDNYVDVLLKDTDIVTRPPRSEGGEIPTDTFLAEHGLSLLITVYRGAKAHTILLDTGYSKVGVPHNMARLGIKAHEIEAIVLSHAHMDHTGSLYPLLEKMPSPILLVVHPDAFLFPRFIKEDDGTKRRFPRTLIKDDLAGKKVNILESKTPTLIADDLVMITGDVERNTAFEKGLPNAVMERDGRIEKDPVSDDQALLINLKGKGLVILSGCSHAGIINTVMFAKKITGVQKIHAVMGGFHLSGLSFEQIIKKTIEELKKIAPEIVVPMHCTGWKAIQRFSEEFPSSFILNSVGSKFVLS